MNEPKYKPRTHKFLESRLRKALNDLCMRDWEVNLITGEYVPNLFLDVCDNAASVKHDTSTLKADIWINFGLAKKNNQDPLNLLYHEVAHIWWAYCDDEERQCNILALLMRDK